MIDLNLKYYSFVGLILKAKGCTYNLSLNLNLTILFLYQPRPIFEHNPRSGEFGLFDVGMQLILRLHEAQKLLGLLDRFTACQPLDYFIPSQFNS